MHEIPRELGVPGVPGVLGVPGVPGMPGVPELICVHDVPGVLSACDHTVTVKTASKQGVPGVPGLPGEAG